MVEQVTNHKGVIAQLAVQQTKVRMKAPNIKPTLRAAVPAAIATVVTPVATTTAVQAAKVALVVAALAAARLRMLDIEQTKASKAPFACRFAHTTRLERIVLF
jgi:uncharacterized membrane protein